MQKDIRKIIEENKSVEQVELSTNHRVSFQQKMQQELHSETSSKKKYTKWLAAASIVVLFGLGITFYPKNSTEVKEDKPVKEVSLGSLSPELKSIESYYVNSINYEISSLDVNESNKEILDGYLAKISELSTEYKSLTKELNTKGVNDELINALINNLQLRLQLLQRLKKQLNELKQLNSKQNETQHV